MVIKKEERHQYVDMVAAKVILEDYLNMENTGQI